MNVEELSKLSVTELRGRATTSLDGVESMSAMERQHHLVEAQFYIDEIERRAQADEREEHDKIAKRDYRLEIWVIVLIGVEILLSIAGIAIGYREGTKQTAVLDALKVSVDSLNVSTSKTAENIASLTKAQTDALNTQKQSFTTISAMNSAMQNQLDILRQDQKQRLAELAKRPLLQLTSGGIRLDMLPAHPVFPKEITATHATLEFVLTNIGDATARAFNVYIGVDNKDVSLSSDNSFARTLVPSESSELNSAINIPLPVLSANGRVVLVLKLQYPNGTKSFNLNIWANGENIPNLSLGNMVVRVPTFSSP